MDGKFDFQEWMKANDKMKEERAQFLRGEMYQHAKMLEIQREIRRKKSRENEE